MVNLGVRLLEKDINQELMSLNVDLDKEGNGSISGTSLCGQLRNPTAEKHSLLLITFGLFTGASLVSTPADIEKCARNKSASVESVLQVQQRKDAKGLPANSLHNSAWLPAKTELSFIPWVEYPTPTDVNFTSRFDLVDFECRKLQNVKYITFLNSNDPHEQAGACIGLSSRDAKKLRLILLPVSHSAEPYKFIADFERGRETE